MVRAKFLLTLILVSLSFAEESRGTILWAGGEDIDFPLGIAPGITTTSSRFRPGYARSALYPNGIARSNPFSGGAVTSVWLSAYMSNNSSATSQKYIGLGKTGTGNSLWVGCSSSSASKFALWKYDGTTWTQLATESDNKNLLATLFKLDMEVVNYGAAATVRVYLDGSASPIITYTGDVTAGGNTSLDDVRFFNSNTNNYFSEFIVSTADTRLMSVVTHAPNAAGSSNTFSGGAFGDVSEITQNDTNYVSSAVSGQVFQANLIDAPSGSFRVVGVRQVTRAASSGSGITGLKPGLFTNSAADLPTATTLTPGWTLIERLYPTNPVLAAPWTTTDLNSLQIHMESAP